MKALKTYSMKQSDIPLNDLYSVVVIGGGPAGCAAATAAAREGASTLLIESTFMLGGMGTAGLIPAWCPFSDKEKIIYGGIAKEVFTKSKENMPHINASDNDWVAIDSENLKRVYDDMLTRAGVDILFGSTLCRADAENGQVNAIIVSNKAGLTAFTAKVFIDCTGDGDLAVMANASYDQGDESGETMPATHCFTLTNVDMYAYDFAPGKGRFRGGLHPSNKNSISYCLAKDPKYPSILDSHLCNSLIGPGAVGFNAGHIWDVDGTDPFSVSKAMVEGRKIAYEYERALKDYFPEAFANAYLSSTASVMGIRESRRIIGDYILTLDDYLNRRNFSDEISRNCYYIDTHYTKEESALVDAGKLDKSASHARYSKGESHGIPYRCLTPAGLTNVLVAGRTISADRAVSSSVRVMPVCLTTGEAAGTSAAICASLDNTVNTHGINISLLRSRLKANGAYLP